MTNIPPDVQSKKMPPVYDRSVVPEFKSRWEVYLQPKCDWSKKVLEYLKKQGETDITIIDIVEKQLITTFYSKGHSSTPIIFRNGKYFGGYPEIIQFYQQTRISPEDIRY